MERSVLAPRRHGNPSVEGTERCLAVRVEHVDVRAITVGKEVGILTASLLPARAIAAVRGAQRAWR